MSDPATREAVDAVHRVLTEAGVTGLDTRWWAAACKVAHGLLNAKRPTPAATIVAAARWAMDAKQAKYHAGRLLRPGGIRELVQLYEATAMNDGLDWTGVPPELEASYRTPSHHLSQGQVDVLKTPREPSEVIAVGLPGPQTSGHPP